MQRKSRSPIPRGATLKIWNSLRDKYSINPGSFKSKNALVEWMKKRNKKMANTIKNTTFWDNTKEMYPHRTKSYTKKGRPVSSYARTRAQPWKADEVAVLRNLKVKDKLKGKELVSVFNNYYPGRTYSSITTKSYRI